MTFFSLLAGGGGSVAPSDPTPSIDATVPYTLPTSQPYNVDITARIPTPEGTGQTVHPDVIDFKTQHGKDAWNGYRFWMGITPYPGGAPRTENPCVLASHDGFNWVVPPGGTNPLDPGVGSDSDANSDTDLTYDPVGDRLLLIYRFYSLAAKTEDLYLIESKDGSTWSAKKPIIRMNGVADGTGKVTQALSPAMVRMSATDWRLFTCGNEGMPETVRTASNPYGPWSGPTVCTYTGSGKDPYHMDAIKGPDGRFWAVAMDNGFFPAVSNDGVSWKTGPAFLSSRAGKWDAWVYRATMTPHENGTHMRLWYSAMNGTGLYPTSYGDQGWHTGYTLVRRDHWAQL